MCATIERRERTQQIIFIRIELNEMHTHDKWVQGVYWRCDECALRVERTAIYTLSVFFMFVMWRIIYFVELIPSLIYYFPFLFYYVLGVRFHQQLQLSIYVAYGGGEQSMPMKPIMLKASTHHFLYK